MPGGARNYLASVSSAMLPLLASDGFQKIEILICGGAPNNDFTSTKVKYIIADFTTLGESHIVWPSPVPLQTH